VDVAALEEVESAGSGFPCRSSRSCRPSRLCRFFALIGFSSCPPSRLFAPLSFLFLPDDSPWDPPDFPPGN